MDWDSTFFNFPSEKVMFWKIIEKLDFMTLFLKADGEAGHLALSPARTEGINYTKNFQFRMVTARELKFSFTQQMS